MTSPEMAFNLALLIIATEAAAVAIAEPIIPYMRND